MSDDKETTNYPTVKELEDARARARQKLADDIVAQEFGTKTDIPRKGPIKRKERMCEITLDLAPHSDRLVIDGTIYFHGRTYTVPQSLFDVMREQQYRGWEHQREIDGKDRDFYRNRANVVLRSGSEGRSAESLLGR